MAITTAQLVIGCGAAISCASMIADIKRQNSLGAALSFVAMAFFLISLSQTTPA